MLIVQKGVRQRTQASDNGLFLYHRASATLSVQQIPHTRGNKINTALNIADSLNINHEDKFKQGYTINIEGSTTPAQKELSQAVVYLLNKGYNVPNQNIVITNPPLKSKTQSCIPCKLLRALGKRLQMIHAETDYLRDMAKKIREVSKNLGSVR